MHPTDENAPLLILQAHFKLMGHQLEHY